METSWSCSFCTFKNASHRTDCETCGLPHEQQPVQQTTNVINVEDFELGKTSLIETKSIYFYVRLGMYCLHFT